MIDDLFDVVVGLQVGEIDSWADVIFCSFDVIAGSVSVIVGAIGDIIDEAIGEIIVGSMNVLCFSLLSSIIELIY